jgi:hypothetical protein
MHRILALAGLALALTTLPAAAQMTTIDPGTMGRIFCVARLGNDMGPVTGLLSPSLTQAIADAEKKDAEWEKKNPGDKPPLGDGIPWQAFQDYAPQCTIGTVDSVLDEASVELNYAFPDAPEANFTDKLRFVQVMDHTVGGPVWRIDNVEYANDGGDLRSTLISAFAEWAPTYPRAFARPYSRRLETAGNHQMPIQPAIDHSRRLPLDAGGAKAHSGGASGACARTFNKDRK